MPFLLHLYWLVRAEEYCYTSNLTCRCLIDTVAYRWFDFGVVVVDAAFAVLAQTADVGDGVRDEALVDGAREEPSGEGSLREHWHVLSAVRGPLTARSGAVHRVHRDVGGGPSGARVPRARAVEQRAVRQSVQVRQLRICSLWARQKWKR